jgi:hypothetical protein
MVDVRPCHSHKFRAEQKVKRVKSQPLVIIGAPRSGTTFLCHVLNQHPLIHLTNESRIFVLIKDLIEKRSFRPHLIGCEFRDQFVAFMRRNAGDLVERFYREGLEVTAPIWGDKHPPYADPAVLSGRKGAEPKLPRSGSCLRLIQDCLPTTKFIHIHRDPLQVAQSLLGRRWADSLDDGVQIWRDYISEIVEFLGEIDEAQHLTVPYGDLLVRPAEVASAIGRFLDLADAEPLAAFLRAQRLRPTPFSDPVTDLAAAYDAGSAQRANGHTLALAGDAAERLGYTPSWASADPAPKMLMATVTARSRNRLMP